MPNTYTELDKVSVSGTSTTTINFTNIPLGYTDLVIVANCGISNSDYLNLRAGNGSVNTGSIYSQTALEGNGSSATSSRGGSRTAFWPSWTTTIMPTSVTANYIINIMNYSNTTTNKTFLSRGNVASAGLDAIACLWSSTVAINTISLFPNSQDGRYFLAGSTFSLYGIANADQGAAKATGGIITEDSQYWYHTFGASSAFIPKQSLTCDVLVVAGGGGSGAGYTGNNRGPGGGGAGGFRTATAQSLTATTYNVTVGGGNGAPGGTSTAAGTKGSNSVFNTITSTGGGGGGWGEGAGTTGGSGGGSGDTGGAGAAGNQGGYSPVEGFAGGAGANSTGGGGGGGGSSAVGSAGTGATPNGIGGAGGAGTSNSYSGTAVVYAAGGKGGDSGPAAAGSNGIAYTGNGGNAPKSGTGTGLAGGNGGSGVVIIRYAK